MSEKIKGDFFDSHCSLRVLHCRKWAENTNFLFGYILDKLQCRVVPNDLNALSVENSYITAGHGLYKCTVDDIKR